MGRCVPEPPGLRAGARVGLLGGSFDPPHAGHLTLSLRALRQGRLDWVWWLVAAQNPLKQHAPRASLSERLTRARLLCGHPLRRIWATDIEARLGIRHTLESVLFLQGRFPQLRFVLLMGADNLAQLPQWHAWRQLVSLIPLLVAPRGAEVGESCGCLVRARLAGNILSRDQNARLAMRAPPGLCFLAGAKIAISSTLLRNRIGSDKMSAPFIEKGI